MKRVNYIQWKCPLLVIFAETSGYKKYFCRRKFVQIMKKLIKKSAIIKDTTSDSLKNRIKKHGTKKNLPLLEEFERLWMGMQGMRDTRKRNFRYVFGDQWGDLVQDERGRWVTERSRIMQRTGGIALQNNHLFKVVNSIVGVYCKSQSMPVCFARQEDADAKSQMMTNALQTNYERNEMKELLQNCIYEIVCGGLPVLTEEWGAHEGEEDSYTYPVNPDYFVFRNKGTDPRMWDVDLVGEIRDFTLGELANRLAESEYDYKQIEAIYAPFLNDGMDFVDAETKLNDPVFATPPTSNLCRTYCIWTLEYKRRYRCYDPMDLEQPLFRIEVEDLTAIEAENEARILEGVKMGWELAEVPLIEYKEIVDQYWHYQMLSPMGDILEEYDSPYEHGSHPYIFTPHHYINGKIFPFIGVIIDQQRYINRLISLHDLAVQNAAKGVKMIPTNVLGGLSPKQFAKQWTEIGGYVFYTPDPKMPNAVPQVVTTNATNIGTSELLQLEVEWINDISTVSGAMQGAQANAGTPASRYAMEMQNSTTSVSSLFARFNSFELQLARKKLKMIHQYYQEPRNISVQHSSNYFSYAMYQPQEVADIDFSVSVKQEAETPVARMAINDLVTQMWQTGVISAKQMLSWGYFPGSDRMIQELEAAEEAQAQQGMAQGMSPELMQQVASGANQDTVAQVRDVLRG